MDSNRKTAIIVGILFIIATVAYSISVVLLDPILGDSDFLTMASENENLVILGAFLVLIDCVAVAGIGICLYPILKKHGESLALGYAGARIVEAVFFIVNVIAILTLLALSQEFVKTGAPDAFYQTLGTLLLVAGEWAFWLGFGLAFGISALILNFVLFQSKLIPRWLSGLGFVGAVLVIVNYLLYFFSINPVEIFYLPIAVQEMVFAVWLIVKGFKS
jgi:hypothetical protein